MRWRPWPLSGPRKYEVRLVVRRMEGWDLVPECGEKEKRSDKLTVEVRWKGPKFALRSLRRTVKRNFTKEVEFFGGKNGVVEWDEEFQSVCTLSPQKENVFHPWEIAFTVFNVGLFSSSLSANFVKNCPLSCFLFSLGVGRIATGESHG